MARYEIPPGYTIGLVATMPRSGTWYSFYLFEFLDVYLSGRTTLSTRLAMEIYASMALAKVHTHTICPGFLEHVRGPLRERWGRLEFHQPGFNFGYGKFIAGNLEVFSPAENPQVRVVHVYRNPLDQCVSYYRHGLRNVDARKKRYRDKHGAEVPIENVRHYLYSVGLDGYLKQHLTFRAMQERFPENLLLVPYESLVREPALTFQQVLDFLGFRIDDERRQRCFARALRSSSSESLKNVEVALGGPLGHDQEDAAESHLRGGAIGKWRTHFDKADVAFARGRLAAFGLDLEGFVLA